MESNHLPFRYQRNALPMSYDRLDRDYSLVKELINKLKLSMALGGTRTHICRFSDGRSSR